MRNHASASAAMRIAAVRWLRRLFKWLLITVAVLILLLEIMNWALFTSYKFMRIRIGQSEKVLSSKLHDLGRPFSDTVITNANADYHVDGYAFRKLRIEPPFRLLIYYDEDQIAYIGIRDGVVRDYYVGGS
jgi:hypothetical protein